MSESAGKGTRRDEGAGWPWVIEAFAFLVRHYGFEGPTVRHVSYETTHEYRRAKVTVDVTSDDSAAWVTIVVNGQHHDAYSLGYDEVMDEYYQRYESLAANARFLEDHPELIAGDAQLLDDLYARYRRMRDRRDRALGRRVAVARMDAKQRAGDAIHRARDEIRRGRISERAWYQRVGDVLADAYLSDNDPRWQSGFDGGEQRWRDARQLVLECVTHDGTFLDVGCANGYLMESLQRWALRRRPKRRLLLYGLELNDRLVSRARERLPDRADRIFRGNVIDWKPPIRFTYVRTGLEYVLPTRYTKLIQRVRRDFLQPGGRLILGPFASLELTETDVRAAGVSEYTVHSASDSHGKTRHVMCIPAAGDEDSGDY